MSLTAKITKPIIHGRTQTIYHACAGSVPVLSARSLRDLRAAAASMGATVSRYRQRFAA